MEPMFFWFIIIFKKQIKPDKNSQKEYLDIIFVRLTVHKDITNQPR